MTAASGASGADGGPRLTHVDARGEARMVDVSAKEVTAREATAVGSVRCSTEVVALLRGEGMPKGDALAVARLAGIQAAKRTDELIPLAHQVPLSHVDLEIEVDAAAGLVTIHGEASTVAGTGVEMEALTACAVAALTIYDMVKGIERGVSVERIELVEKTGGKSDWRRDP